MTDYKIGICIPTRDSWRADFGQSLALMTVATMSLLKPQDGLGFRIINKTQCSIPHLARNVLVDEAINNGCTHVLFLDDDMRFPMNTLTSLLYADKDIIGANCTTKEIPPRPAAKGLDGKLLHTLEESSGVEEVQSVGTGILLIKSIVFSKLPRPWFDYRWEPDGKKLAMGEDRFFCHLARGNGFQIFIDHDVSKRVFHIGDFAYGHEQTEEFYGPSNV